MPSAPAIMTVDRSSAGAMYVAVSTRRVIAMTTSSISSLPIFSSGRSIHDSQVISFCSKTKPRNSISRNMPPKAAICGWRR